MKLEIEEEVEGHKTKYWANDLLEGIPHILPVHAVEKAFLFLFGIPALLRFLFLRGRKTPFRLRGQQQRPAKVFGCAD